MIIRDQFGYLHEVPNRQFVGAFKSRLGEAVYDGFGSPLGAFPALAALIPAVASALPALFSRRSARPRPPSAPPAPLPSPFGPAPVAALPIGPPVVAPAPQVIVIREPAPAPPRFFPLPGSAQPRIVYRRRRPRRRVPVRLRVREEVTAPPAAVVRLQPPLVSVSPPAPVPAPLPLPAPSVATESSGGLGGAFYGPFSFFG
jgi:hypothetical protein